MIGAAGPPPERIRAAAGAVQRHLEGYEAPDFAEAPGPDAALFLCAIDHSSGYERPHCVNGAGPFKGSELIWHLGCAVERRAAGALGAQALRDVDAAAVEGLFRVEEETISRAPERARLWRDLAARLIEGYEGSAGTLLSRSGGRLRGAGGLIARLASFDAFSDPLEKKAFLFAKIAARRGWLSVADPESWEVCADNVLMRVCLRAGLVDPGPAEQVRADTRSALKAVALAAKVEPPLLDDLVWERGRLDPALLGDVRPGLDAPPRPAGTFFY